MVSNFRIGGVALALVVSVVTAPVLVKGVTAQGGAPSAGAETIPFRTAA